jgi:hypothetical protein
VFVRNYKDGTKTISFAELEAAGLGLDLTMHGVPIKDGVNDRFTPSFIYALE